MDFFFNLLSLKKSPIDFIAFKTWYICLFGNEPILLISLSDFANECRDLLNLFNVLEPTKIGTERRLMPATPRARDFIDLLIRAICLKFNFSDVFDIV